MRLKGLRCRASLAKIRQAMLKPAASDIMCHTTQKRGDATRRRQQSSCVQLAINLVLTSTAYRSKLYCGRPEAMAGGRAQHTVPYHSAAPRRLTSDAVG